MAPLRALQTMASSPHQQSEVVQPFSTAHRAAASGRASPAENADLRRPPIQRVEDDERGVRPNHLGAAIPQEVCDVHVAMFHRGE